MSSIDPIMSMRRKVELKPIVIKENIFDLNDMQLLERVVTSIRRLPNLVGFKKEDVFDKLLLEGGVIGVRVIYVDDNPNLPIALLIPREASTSTINNLECEELIGIGDVKLNCLQDLVIGGKEYNFFYFTTGDLHYSTITEKDISRVGKVPSTNLSVEYMSKAVANLGYIISTVSSFGFTVYLDSAEVAVEALYELYDAIYCRNDISSKIMYVCNEFGVVSKVILIGTRVIQ